MQEQRKFKNQGIHIKRELSLARLAEIFKRKDASHARIRRVPQRALRVRARGGKLVARVYFDPDAIRKAKLDDAAVAALPGRIRTAVNRRMPAYSRLSDVERNPSPFEKTPKMSIKRFLYK